LFYLLVSAIAVVFFNILDGCIETLLKRYGKALHWVEVNSDPDRKTLDAGPDPAK
jgi:hypothetical protein